MGGQETVALPLSYIGTMIARCHSPDHPPRYRFHPLSFSLLLWKTNDAPTPFPAIAALRYAPLSLLRDAS